LGKLRPSDSFQKRPPRAALEEWGKGGGVKAIVRLLAILAPGFVVAHAAAQDFPIRPITLLCPWPPGGSADTHLRKFAEIASRHLDQQVIVENRPAGGGMIGPGTLKRAVEDPEHLKVLDMLDQELWYQSSEDYAEVWPGHIAAGTHPDRTPGIAVKVMADCPFDASDCFMRTDSVLRKADPTRSSSGLDAASAFLIAKFGGMSC
jgi:hypothetical protein